MIDNTKFDFKSFFEHHRDVAKEHVRKDDLSPVFVGATESGQIIMAGIPDYAKNRKLTLLLLTSLVVVHDIHSFVICFEAWMRSISTERRDLEEAAGLIKPPSECSDSVDVLFILGMSPNEKLFSSYKIEADRTLTDHELGSDTRHFSGRFDDLLIPKELRNNEEVKVGAQAFLAGVEHNPAFNDIEHNPTFDGRYR